MLAQHLIDDEVADHSPADQLLKKHARHQFDVWPSSSDCLVVYNQFVTPKKCLPATFDTFLSHNWKILTIENSNRAVMNSINNVHFVRISGVYKQHPAPRLETKCQTGAPSKH